MSLIFIWFQKFLKYQKHSVSQITMWSRHKRTPSHKSRFKLQLTNFCNVDSKPQFSSIKKVTKKDTTDKIGLLWQLSTTTVLNSSIWGVNTRAQRPRHWCYFPALAQRSASSECWGSLKSLWLRATDKPIHHKKSEECLQPLWRKRQGRGNYL